MRRPSLTARLRAVPPAPAEGRGEGARRAFSLVELLVAVSIMLVLIGLMGAALSSARTSQKKQATQALIAKLDAIISQQFQSYATREVPTATTPADRAAALRRMATGDLPDRWEDVKFMANNAVQFKSPHQRAYIAVWNSMNPPPANNAFDAHPQRNTYAGAECLFMIVMRGGIADCVDCSDLVAGKIGDKDGDGAFEFWDSWGNPIGYILWPAALELPASSGTRFFGTSPPFLPGAVGETMRPLVYSGGPDANSQDNGDFGFTCNASQSNLLQGANCGNPGVDPTAQFARPLPSAADNITNLDEEAKR